MYSVETDAEILEQLDALPAGALPSYAEALTALAVAPWSGHPYDRSRPDGNLRTLAFGEYGFLIYLVIEDQRRVFIVRIVWAG